MEIIRKQLKTAVVVSDKSEYIFTNDYILHSCNNLLHVYFNEKEFRTIHFKGKIVQIVRKEEEEDDDDDDDEDENLSFLVVTREPKYRIHDIVLSTNTEEISGKKRKNTGSNLQPQKKQNTQGSNFNNEFFEVCETFKWEIIPDPSGNEENEISESYDLETDDDTELVSVFHLDENKIAAVYSNGVMEVIKMVKEKKELTTLATVEVNSSKVSVSMSACENYIDEKMFHFMHGLESAHLHSEDFYSIITVDEKGCSYICSFSNDETTIVSKIISIDGKVEKIFFESDLVVVFYCSGNVITIQNETNGIEMRVTKVYDCIFSPEIVGTKNGIDLLFKNERGELIFTNIFESRVTKKYKLNLGNVHHICSENDNIWIIQKRKTLGIFLQLELPSWDSLEEYHKNSKNLTQIRKEIRENLFCLSENHGQKKFLLEKKEILEELVRGANISFRTLSYIEEIKFEVIPRVTLVGLFFQVILKNTKRLSKSKKNWYLQVSITSHLKKENHVVNSIPVDHLKINPELGESLISKKIPVDFIMLLSGYPVEIKVFLSFVMDEKSMYPSFIGKRVLSTMDFTKISPDALEYINQGKLMKRHILHTLEMGNQQKKRKLIQKDFCERIALDSTRIMELPEEVLNEGLVNYGKEIGTIEFIINEPENMLLIHSNNYYSLQVVKYTLRACKEKDWSLELEHVGKSYFQKVLKELEIMDMKMNKFFVCMVENLSSVPKDILRSCFELDEFVKLLVSKYQDMREKIQKQ